MSFHAIEWALSQTVGRASAKLVLIGLASFVRKGAGPMLCFPATATLCDVTEQDRKTVLANIQFLKEAGFVVDTGQRVGRTGQITVFELKQPGNGTLLSPGNGPESGTASQGVNDPESGILSGAGNDTETGMLEESQNRNSTENGTVPNFLSNSTVFPSKESQISAETVPLLGHGTRYEPGIEPGKE